jgi:hypothetical protein
MKVCGLMIWNRQTALRRRIDLLFTFSLSFILEEDTHWTKWYTHIKYTQLGTKNKTGRANRNTQKRDGHKTRTARETLQFE